MTGSRTIVVISLLTLSRIAAAPEARSADTLEPTGHGTLDHEMYLVVDGVRTGGSGTLLAQYLAGMGVAPRFSVFLGADTVLHPAGTGLEARFVTGAIGTPLDTDHVDIDLGIELDLVDGGPAGVLAGPLLELNYDGEPDLSLWGLYLHAGLPLFWTGDSPAIDVEVELGAYVTFRDQHQILVETAAQFRPMSSDRGGLARFQGISLGYNVTVHEALEIILEILLDVPQGREPVSAGFLGGVIVTLPGRSHM